MVTRTGYRNIWRQAAKWASTCIVCRNLKFTDGLQSSLLRNEQHKKAGSTLCFLLFYGETFDWMSEPRLFICRKQRKAPREAGQRYLILCQCKKLATTKAGFIMNESFNQPESYCRLDCFDFMKQIARTILCF